MNHSTENNIIDDTLHKKAYNFYNEVLGKPQYILAPMVDQSELPWRLLSRRYGCQLTYTPMLHAAMFIKSQTYRTQALATSPDDKPLIVQFCANDPETFVEACLLAQDHCDAIDLNLGCPQSIAKRGHYGSFLQDEWDLISSLIISARKAVRVPLTAKIRVFPEVSRTVEYAQMLERAGVSILAVHGRIRDQRGIHTGLADWTKIKAVKEALKIPVFANGNIQYLSDVNRCITETGVDGVMIAEGNLHNPALFAGIQPLATDIALEYLELVHSNPCPLSYARGHVFKLLQHTLLVHLEFRDYIGESKSIFELEDSVRKLKLICGPGKCDNVSAMPLPHPHWLCQPYERPSPLQSSNSSELTAAVAEPILGKRPAQNSDLAITLAAERKRRKEEKRAVKAAKAASKPKPPSLPGICKLCKNLRGKKCAYSLCRSCCVEKTNVERINCSGHNIHLTISKRKRTCQDVFSGDSNMNSSSTYAEPTNVATCASRDSC